MLALAGCPAEDHGPVAEPFFPADYAATYTEVRACRASGDHELHNIRIFADALALTPYEQRNVAFPVDAIVLKAEYDFGDSACTEAILEWSVMQRLPEGSAPATLDWAWQGVDAERQVVEEDLPRCIGCHQSCGVPPDGYQGTCAVP